MNPVQMRQHRSVTERLSARLDVLELLVDRMLRNGDALYQGHEANAARITKVEEALRELVGVVKNLNASVQALSDEGGRMDQLHEKRLDAAHVHISKLTVWQRLRWLTGG